MVKFFTLEPLRELKDRRKLKSFIERLVVKEKKRLAQLGFVFCSDDYLLKINQDFLQHDYFTDIITFDLSTSASEIEGEIYISIDRVRDNARMLEVDIVDELHRVIFHGVLHLCGYKDKLKTDKALMRKKEDYYLKRYKG
jgi:probable rRNA maturation factor